MEIFQKRLTRFKYFRILTLFLALSLLFFFVLFQRNNTNIKTTQKKFNEGKLPENKQLPEDRKLTEEQKLNFKNEKINMGGEKLNNEKENSGRTKGFWNHKELSWVPNYFRNRELGSGIISLPNKFLNSDNKNTLQTKDNIGGKVYPKAQGYPPIDMVVMWVNGSDPIFQKEKENGFLHYDNCEKTCKYPKSKMPWCCPKKHKKEKVIRFSQHDELKYLLRQIDQFAPWIRKIFLVTNNQIPNWLDLSNNRVEIVVPSDFVKYPESLPTFSSPALESQLHLIKGLSRLFLYFNDDFFLTKPIWPSDFITADNEYKRRTLWRVPQSDLKIYQKTPTKETLSKTNYCIYTESLKYTDTIFDITFGERGRYSAQHAPTLIDREIMERIWDEWPNEMEQTAKAKFRIGSQMHYQTTFLNYIQDSWINLNFCNYFNLYFDKNNDKHFDLWEIKTISDQISKFFSKDAESVFSMISDQIAKELQKQLFEDHDTSDNGHATNHDSENPILDLKVHCEILEKIPLLVEYYNQKIGKGNKKLQLFKTVQETRDSGFYMLNSISQIKPSFAVIRYKKDMKFIAMNDDFEYSKKSQLIRFDEEFQKLANEQWPNKSQFELPENLLNQNLRIKYS
ncbi:hypothetical protein M0812_25031 [Anaeramoeba flamelloides]|uniref:Uncharacterized protein n=1 Tax=Anaeramoeba flamelloides TaxID=1746091 RepID=A0AAV7YIS9_9EUKA|nr:hypothetical protein M0812_25031 [Anaeramoeba flamelloides]